MGKLRSDVDTADIVRAYEGGSGITRLSKQFGMAKAGIQKRLKRAGVYIRSRGSIKKDRGVCVECSAPITVRRNRFCSSSCSAKHNNKLRRRETSPKPGPKPKRPPLICATCGAEHKRKRYCSDACNPRRNVSEEDKRKRKRLTVLLAVRRYQARLLSQIPEDADLGKIKQIYAGCPAGCEVDHIIPISRGGLHHQDNLQYLPMTENRRKSNKLPHELRVTSSTGRALDS